MISIIVDCPLHLAAIPDVCNRRVEVNQTDSLVWMLDTEVVQLLGDGDLNALQSRDVL